MPDKVVTVYKLQDDHGGQFLVLRENELGEMGHALIGAEPDDTFTITVEEWGRKELDALPGFDGY